MRRIVWRAVPYQTGRRLKNGRQNAADAAKLDKIMAMNQEIPKIRAQIDALDDKLTALLRRRAELTGKAGAVKRARNEKVFLRAGREAEILRRVASLGGALSESSVRAIYREIISACLAVEKTQTICYLGPEHTFTHDAARKHFGAAADYIPAATVRAAIERAEKELCDFAVVPFENSGEGTVGDTFDALLQTPLAVGGEIMLRVRHNLLAAKQFAPEETELVCAHPQALAQCRQWLEHAAPQAKTRPAESNAAAAQFVAAQKNKKFAAIASLSAAEYYGLKTIAADIEDSPFNTTRFLMLGAAHSAPSGADKTSLVMSARSKAGALYRLLEPFSRLGINMTKFESRPARGQLWEYVFFVDIDGHRDSPKTARALDEIGERAAFLKVLGSYPRAVD